MNSAIHKVSMEVPQVGSIRPDETGPTLHRKLVCWCETDPTLVMWETSFVEPKVKAFAPIGGGELEIDSDWMIEFRFMRGVRDGSYWKDAFLLDGKIKRSVMAVEGRSVPAYTLTINTGRHGGIYYQNNSLDYQSAQDLWMTLVNLGVKKA